MVNNEKVTDHHAIIPTNAEHHPVDRMNEDDRKIYDLVVRRFLAIFHPEAISERTNVETTVGEHVFRTRGKVLIVPGWRGVYGELADAESAGKDDDEGAEQRLPKLAKGERARVARDRLRGQGDQAPRTLQRRLAGEHDGDRGQAGRRRGGARGDEGVGYRHRRPRAPAIIERLIQVGYVERDRTASGGHREGPERDPPARRARPHLADA